MSLNHNIDAMKKAADMTGPATATKRKPYTPKERMAFEDAAEDLSLVSHGTRLAILHALSKEEADVGALAEVCGISISAVSQNMTKLKAGRLVEVERRAQRMVYRLTNPVRALVTFALGLVEV